MHIDLTQRVAVVTGGANGIGRATARRLAQSGARVAIWDRVAAVGEATAAALAGEGLEVCFVEADVTQRASVNAAVAATVARFGGIDILINNAGITRDAQLVKIKDGAVTGGMTDDEFDAVIAVNLKGVYTCTQAVVPELLKRGGGRIVNASSVVALNGNFGQTNYVATKAGVIGMTKLVNVDKASFVFVGFTAVSKAVAPVGDRAKTVMVNGGAVGPDLAGLSPYFWNVIPLAHLETQALLPFLIRRRNLKRIALVYVLAGVVAALAGT